jgi:hypothetical protein
MYDYRVNISVYKQFSLAPFNKSQTTDNDLSNYITFLTSDFKSLIAREILLKSISTLISKKRLIDNTISYIFSQS